jgi:hypothetical protein
MRKIDFLALYANASGLRILVLANRLGCKTDRERALHDWVATDLARFITFTRSALVAERAFLTNTDPTKIDDLGEDFYNFRYNYENHWREEDGCDVWDLVPPEMAELRTILGEIHRSLKIYISGWGLVLPKDPAAPASDRDGAADDEDDDISCWERLHGSPW